MKNRVLVWASIVSLVTFLIVAIKGILTNFSLKYDLIINNYFSTLQNSLLINASKTIGIIFDTWSLLTIAIFVSIYLWFKDSKKDAVFFTLSMAIGAAAIFILKEIFQRARPLNILVTETSSSFPSGHATIAVIFFGILTYLILKRDHSKFERRVALAISPLMILLMGLSRIIINAHWFSDVIAGYCTGIFILSICIMLRKMSDKFEKIIIN